MTYLPQSTRVPNPANKRRHHYWLRHRPRFAVSDCGACGEIYCAWQWGAGRGLLLDPFAKFEEHNPKPNFIHLRNIEGV